MKSDSAGPSSEKEPHLLGAHMHPPQPCANICEKDLKSACFTAISLVFSQLLL